MFRFFENLLNPYQDYCAEDRPPRTLRPFLWLYLRPFRYLFIFAACTSVIVAAMEVALIWYLGRVVTLMTESSPSAFLGDHGVELALVTVAVLIVRPLLQGLDVLLMNQSMMPNVGTLVRYRAHRHVLGQSVGWFENDFAGRIANRIMQTPPAMGEVVFQVFDAIAFSTAYFIGALVMLYGVDARLSIPLLIWIALFAALVVWTVKRIGPAAKAASDARSQVTARVVDSYTNIHSVKMFDHHEAELDYAVDAIEYARSTFQRENRLFTLMDFGLVTLNGVLVVALVGVSLAMWINGTAELGVLAAAAALALRINGMSGWIMWATTSFFRELGIVSEGMETIASPIDVVDRADAKPMNLKQASIEIQDVHHHYGQEKGGLNGVSLSIQPGEKVGLVGRSGAGKSTLIKLILRFYDAEQGRILIDGQDVQSVTQKSLRAHIGVVQQENALLHRTVRENVLFGKPDATEEEFAAAIKGAVADGFVTDLVDQDGNQGLEAKVGERGVKLSGGQRQRISLARVLLKNAPILILDEATAALDSEVEAQIQDALFAYMEDKTVIAIAHRLSTIVQMDRIVVLDKGQIVEVGTHDDLVAAGGLYADLWSRQSGGFLGQEEE